VSAVKQSIENDSSKLSIGTLPVLPVNIITKNVHTFLNKNPEISFDIYTCIDNSEIIRGVLEGTYDIGLCYKIIKENNLVYIPIMKRELVVITKYGHELSQKKSLCLSDLQNMPLITYGKAILLAFLSEISLKRKILIPTLYFHLMKK